MTLVVVALSLASLLAHASSDSDLPDAGIDDIYWSEFCGQEAEIIQKRLDGYAEELNDKDYEELNRGEQIVLSMYQTRRREPELCTPEHGILLEKIYEHAPKECYPFLSDEISSWSANCMQIEIDNLKNQAKFESLTKMLKFIQDKTDSRVFRLPIISIPQLPQFLTEYFLGHAGEKSEAGFWSRVGEIYDVHAKKPCDDFLVATKTMHKFYQIYENYLSESDMSEEEPDMSKEATLWVNYRDTCNVIVESQKSIKRKIIKLVRRTHSKN